MKNKKTKLLTVACSCSVSIKARIQDVSNDHTKTGKHTHLHASKKRYPSFGLSGKNLGKKIEY